MRAGGQARILIGGLAIMASCVAAMSARAAPLDSCAPGNAIYRATTDERYEIEFSKDFGETSAPSKTGVLRYRGRAGSIQYELETAWSNGLAALYVAIEGDRKRNSDPEALDYSSVDPEAARARARELSSEMLPLGSDFGFHQNNKTAAPYLVIPKLGREFYYWPEEQARHPAEKVVPPEAWKLVQCRD
jgi:hypothetical protein